jgi:hypothetical protein
MSEVQREEILFNRAEERKEIQEHNRLMREARAAQGISRPSSSAAAGKATSKSKGGASKAKPGQNKKRAALSDIAARRQNKTDTKRSHDYQGDEDDDGGRDDFYGDDDDDDADIDDEDDGDYGGKRKARAAGAQAGASSALGSTPLKLKLKSSAKADKEIHSDPSRSSGSTGGSSATAGSSLQHQQQPQQDLIAHDQQLLSNVVDLTLSDLRKAVISRTLLLRWRAEPFFEKAVKGLYVRVRVGEKPNPNFSEDDHGVGHSRDSRSQNEPRMLPVYRIGEIINAVACEPYKFQLSKDEIYELPYKLSIAISGQARTKTIDIVSSKPIEAEEYGFFVKDAKRSNAILPSRAHLERLYDQIKRYETYVYTEEDFQWFAERYGKKDDMLARKIALAARLNEDLSPEVLETVRQEYDEIERHLGQRSTQNTQYGSRAHLDIINQRNRSQNVIRDASRSTQKTSTGGSNAFVRRNTIQDNTWLTQLGKKGAKAGNENNNMGALASDASSQANANASTSDVLDTPLFGGGADAMDVEIDIAKIEAAAASASAASVHTLAPLPSHIAPVNMGGSSSSSSSKPIKVVSLGDLLKKK